MKPKNDKKIELTKDDFSFVCPLKTENMNRVEGGYFCGKCRTKIYDVSDYTSMEYRELVRKNSGLCVTFKKVVTVSLVLGLAACSKPEIKPNIETQREVTTQSHSESSSNRLTPPSEVDSNQTLYIERVESVIAVGMPILEEPPSTEDE